MPRRATTRDLMLRDTHGIDVGDRMYLLRMHSDRAQHERVVCCDLRAEAKLLLDAEAARLAAAPQPTQAAASPAAPDTTSPAPDAANAGIPAQGDSSVRKRPRGAAPAGQVWQEGAWIDARKAKQVQTPATACALKPKPRGLAPKGKLWDGKAGVWVIDPRRVGAKRAAPEPSNADENAPPQPSRARRRRDGPICA